MTTLGYLDTVGHFKSRAVLATSQPMRGLDWRTQGFDWMSWGLFWSAWNGSSVCFIIWENRLSLNASTAQTYSCTSQKSITTSLKNEYQYTKILYKSIINNKNNQQNTFVTLTDTRLVTSWRLLVRPIIKSSNFREEKNGRKLVRAISAESIYRCMLLFLDHILYRIVHFVRDALRALRAVLAINTASLERCVGNFAYGDLRSLIISIYNI